MIAVFPCCKIGHVPSQSPGNCINAIRKIVDYECRKFITAEASRDVRIAKCALEHFRDSDESPVTFLMAEFIIYLLQIIQIGVEDEKIVFQSASTFHVLATVNQKSSAVIKTGEFIAEGHARKFHV